MTAPLPGPLLDRGAVAAHVDAWRAEGLRVVFSNGVFDILHPGHVRYLTAARALGDRLIVAINSDRSVRGNKGPRRPINSERERAEVLLALACVDAVTIFEEATPYEIISLVRPDVLVKGADWVEDAIVGRDLVEANGGRVVRMTIEAGYSTSSIIEKIQALETPGGPTGPP